MAPVIIVLGLFPPPPPPLLHLSPQQWPHVTPPNTRGKLQERWGEPLQRPTSFNRSLLSILGSLLPPESCKGRRHVTDGCSIGLTAGGKVRGGGRSWRADGSDAQVIIVVTLLISRPDLAALARSWRWTCGGHTFFSFQAYLHVCFIHN